MPNKDAIPRLGIQSAEFDDIDAQSAQLSGYDQSYRQLSRGRFVGQFTSLEVPGAGLHVERCNQVIEQAAAVPAGQVALIFLLDGLQPTRFGQRPFGRQSAALVSAGQQIEFCNAVDTTICVLALSIQVIESALAERARNVARASVFSDPLSVERLRRRASGLIGDALTGQILRDTAPRLTASFADLLVDALPPSASEQAVAQRSRPNLFLQARAHIHDHLDRVTVAGIERHLAVSRRSLEYAFEAAVGLSPQRYIAMCRLNAIRRDLLNTTDSIGDVAARHGVWHLGRFAGAYRAAFGELPSATRNR
ncbi:helix-turn-helix domain-containing protein [Oryzibacter oryziterrae]|uniref:helix-turn-helix domain-containing protein n=1 Tax=Oryzibacter oryziterrae TaxID=2766474 RepID=UPI001F01BB24|nr:helix-turn-helix domain-containing protein [Oryzibacter oryziterrae]